MRDQGVISVSAQNEFNVIPFPLPLSPFPLPLEKTLHLMPFLGGFVLAVVAAFPPGAD